MVELRPLILMTGTIHAEGGKRHKTQRGSSSTEATGDNQTLSTFTQKREISKDRRAADVITTTYMRKLRGLRILRTPYGTLIDPARLTEVKAMIDEAAADVVAFNGHSKTCQLSNCMLWEPLKGQRRAAVQGWIARKLADSDKTVEAAIGQLVADPARPGKDRDLPQVR